MKNKISSIPLLAGAVTVALILTATPPAFASETDDSEGASNAVSSQINKVAPEGDVVLGEAELQTFSAGAGDTFVEVPLSAPSSVFVTSQVQDQIKGQGQTVTANIELPQGFVSASGNVASDGTVVYAESDEATAKQDAVAVQTLADGSTRVQTVLASPESAHEFDYGVTGFTPVQDDQGNFAFVGSDGITVPVEPAWAKDANGADVATHYEIRDKKLVQVVAPSAETTYPVIADPTWAWWNAAYGAKLNKTETRDVANSSGNVALCGLGIFANPALAAVCAALGGYMVGQANVARGAGECIIIVVAPGPSVWRYKDGDCY